MKTKNQNTKFYVGIGLLALVLVAYTTLGAVKPQADFSPDQRRSYTPPLSLDTSSAVVALPGTLTKAYRSPDQQSSVVDLYTPSFESLHIHARSEAGDWVLVTRADQQGAAGVWIPAGELNIQGSIWPLPVLSAVSKDTIPVTGAAITASVERLTKVYRGPGAEYEVEDVITPSQTPIQLLGRSQDNTWLAVRDAKDSTQLGGWVPAGEVTLQGDVENLPVVSSTAAAAVLAKVYASPGSTAAIVDILMAQTEFQVLGRSEDAKWLLITYPSGGTNPSGWIQAGETKFNGAVENLQVLSD